MLLAMTAAAIGMGWLSGGYLTRRAGGAGAGAGRAPQDHGTAPSSRGKARRARAGAGPTLVPLAPITTNLAAPADIWIRLEASVVLDAPQPPDADRGHPPGPARLLRTVKLHQIEGASGFQHLKADLEERAAIRSDGHAKQVLIRTLLFE